MTNQDEKIKYAMIGMGSIIDGHPCYAEAMNEVGLSCEGLNFAGYAYCSEEVIEDKINIPPYGLILWAVSNFETVEELKLKVHNLNLVGKAINENTPLPTLYWIVHDKKGDCIVIENTKDKLSIYDNNVGVLTNSPTFDWHITNLSQYIELHPK